MLKTLKNRKELIVIVLAIILFVLYKIPHLNLPFFWDEMGVYGKSIFYLLDNEIGFLPKYLDPELSRGHPMLFVFLNSLFCKIFGSNIFIMHLFNLLISVITLISTYYISTQLFNKKTGLFAFLILITQALFVAQSIMVLPEMMLALFVIWAVYFFIKENWFLYFVFCSLAMLTKETAVFVPPVLAFIIFTWNLKNKQKFFNVLYVLLPFLSFLAFLWIQKIQNGWYFFPYHNPLEEGFLNLNVIREKFNDFSYSLFIEQGRKIQTYIAIVLLIFSFFSLKKKEQYNIFTFVAIIVGLLLFSSTNHFMKRYLLLAIIPFSIIVAFLISTIKKELISYFAIIAFVTISLFQIETEEFDYDNNMNYVKVLNYHKKVATFLENLNDWNSEIFITSNFPISLIFEDTRYGFVEKNHKNINYTIKNNSKYIIESNPGAYTNFIIPPNYIEITFKKEGFNSVKIYKISD